MTKFSRFLTLTLTFFALGLGTLAADDWPRWLGEDMDSTWKEEGITEDFTKSAPKVLWRVPAGLGYSGITVSEGRVFIIDYLQEGGEITNHPSGKDKLMGKERVRALEKRSVVTSLENLMSFPFVKEAVDAGELTLHGLWNDIGEGGLEQYDGKGFSPV